MTNPVITFSSVADPTVIRTDEGFFCMLLKLIPIDSYFIFLKHLVNWEFKRSKLCEKPRPTEDVLPGGGAFGHRKLATSMENMCFISHGQNGGWKHQL